MRIIPAREGFPMTCPGSVCYLCACGPNEGDEFIIDFEQIIEMEGSLMICQKCATDAAHLMEFTSPSETKRLRGRIRNLEDQLLEALRETEIVAGRVRAAVDA